MSCDDFIIFEGKSLYFGTKLRLKMYFCGLKSPCTILENFRGQKVILRKFRVEKVF